jgi:hypothetical protein
MSVFQIFVVLSGGLLAGTSAAGLIQALLGWRERRHPRVMAGHGAFLIGGASLSAWPMLKGLEPVRSIAFWLGLVALSLGAYLWGTMRQRLSTGSGEPGGAA